MNIHNINLCSGIEGRGKMKLAVCEDDLLELEDMRKKLKEVLKAASIEAEIVCFSSGDKLLTQIRNGKTYNLYILDILLENEENGIVVAREIRKSDPEAQIAFFTHSREYAIDAFEVQAIHYLVKPVTKENLQSVIDRWRRENHNQEECLEIQSGKETRKFPVSQILYVKSSDRGIEIHMKQHKWDAWVKSPFHVVEHEVEPMPQFTRIARGCIVNMEYINRIEYMECVLKNGEILSISRREQSHVMNSYNDFLFWKMEQSEEKEEGG